jgi:hypothetical protein
MKNYGKFPMKKMSSTMSHSESSGKVGKGTRKVSSGKSSGKRR